jgi:hypothetical protein
MSMGRKIMVKVLEGTVIDIPKFFITPTNKQLNDAITNLKSLHNEDQDIEANIRGLIKEYSKSKIELECGDDINELSEKDKDRIWFMGYQGLLLRIEQKDKLWEIGGYIHGMDK